MEAEKILIVEADLKTAELASIKLSNAGYLIVTASSAEAALEKAAGNVPELFLVGMDLPGINGLELCYELRNHPQFSGIPIILITDPQFDPAVLEAARIKIDDLLIKPFTPKNLLAKANANISNYRLLKQMNPQTMLPGKVHLKNEINTIIDRGEHFEVVFCDLKDFGTYNKVYGFEAGDRVIMYLAEVFKKLLDEIGIAGIGLYHFGGDDFALLSPESIPERFCQEAIELFRRGIGAFYSEDDRQRGGIVYTNRRGMIEQSPLLTIDMAVVGNFQRHFSDWLEVESIGVELLKYAKTIPGSRWVKDRRISC